MFNKNITVELIEKIKVVDKEIRQYYFQKKKNLARIKNIPNNTKSLQDAVRIAKDLNIQNLPHKMTTFQMPLQTTSKTRQKTS
jgi:hypothetical protein